MISAVEAYRLQARVRDRLFAMFGGRSFAAWGGGTVVRLPLRVKGEGRISLGSGVFIGEGSWLQALGDEGRIEIGDRCEFSGFAVISAKGSIVFEPNVLMARNVHVLDHMHRFDLPDVPVHTQGLTEPEPILLREGAWIGANCVIMPGVTIGRQAVVGANSIVREDVPDRAVAVGAPARVVRHLNQV
jgi:acetyltransferase-like isoleucine patch superfamily enzyme